MCAALHTAGAFALSVTPCSASLQVERSVHKLCMIEPPSPHCFCQFTGCLYSPGDCYSLWEGGARWIGGGEGRWSENATPPEGFFGPSAVLLGQLVATRPWRVSWCVLKKSTTKKKRLRFKTLLYLWSLWWQCTVKHKHKIWDRSLKHSCQPLARKIRQRWGWGIVLPPRA